MTILKVKIPFPYFGGKTKVASQIWKAFGNVPNYVEPFAGSLAVLLANNNIPKIETVNEINPFISNFWRAISKDPEGVAKFANYPVHETELHARHQWLLLTVNDEFKDKMHNDVDFYDVKVAGFWIYGMSASIGSNWLQPKGIKALPLLSSAGGGIQGLTFNILEDFKLLQQRLKRVRVINGDWKRVVTPSITYKSKGLSSKDITGIFLDPPYSMDNRYKVYQSDQDIFKEVCQWAIENGDNPKLRIAVCGYENDFQFPDNWNTYHWQTGGGMSGLGNNQGKINVKRETVWYSPHCIKE